MGYEVPQRLRYVDWHGGFCGEKQDSHCIFTIGEISYCIGWAPLIHEYPSLKRQVFLHLLLKSGRDLMCRTELESTLHPALCFWNNGWFSFGPTLRFSTCPPSMEERLWAAVWPRITIWDLPKSLCLLTALASSNQKMFHEGSHKMNSFTVHSNTWWTFLKMWDQMKTTHCSIWESVPWRQS
jgi:hypothetical protein